MKPEPEISKDLLQEGYEWLFCFADLKLLNARMDAERNRIAATNMGAGSASYGPTEDDRVAAYLLLARASLEAPSNLDHCQAARVLPFLTSIGANREHLAGVENVSERVRRWFAYGQRRAPDQTLFELLVAALYVRNGWSARFVPEAPPKKTPDLSIRRGGTERWAECKRLQPRSEAVQDEKKHWRRLWQPLARQMAIARMAFILDIVFHVALESLADDYLVARVREKLRLAPHGGVLIDDEEITVAAKPADLRRIQRELAQHYVKCGSPQEIQLITNEYRADATHAYSGAIEGDRGTLDDQGLGPALYWDNISFAFGAYWSCDAPAVVERKARDVRSRLAEAVKQLEGKTPSAVHVGIETLEGDLVQRRRFERMLATFARFDAAGTAMDWVYCHLFGPESPPDKEWSFAETIIYHRCAPGDIPLSSLMLVVPDEETKADAVHWERE